MRKTISILTVLLLLWSLVLPAAATGTATAATLRLEKTEGTVKVTNAAGKSVSVTDGMRLYSGYAITTGKNSYAYVSLDSSKAVKLDASSKGEVQKSGKKLELKAVSGKLFFNVSVPVGSSESLNIRTSTMVTGVRGTAGWVEVVDRFTSRVHLLEGTLTVTSTEPATGEIRQAVITGGLTATATLGLGSAPGHQTDLTVTEIREKDIPGFVAVEVAEDPVLQKKITEKSPLSIPKIIGDAEDRLKEEQNAADAAEESLQEQLEEISAEEVEQVFESQPEEDDYDEPPANITRELTNPTAAQLTAALAETGVTRVNVTEAGGDGSDLDTASYTVASGQTLDIQSGTFTVGSGKTLTVASGGALAVTGGTTTLQIAGTANITGSATNSGTITITSTNSLHVLSGGRLTNDGTIQVGNESNAGLLDIQSGGTLNNYKTIRVGDVASEDQSDVASASQLEIKAGGTLNNNSGGTITIAEELATVTNNGTFNNSGDFAVDVLGLFTSTGIYNENRTDELYAMAKNDNDSTVSYLGLAQYIETWDQDSTVTLMGADSGEVGPTVDANATSVPEFFKFSASNVTLNLNGRAAKLNCALTVGSGNLTIQDSAANGTLTADPDPTVTESPALCGVISVTGGSLKLESGTVSGAEETGAEEIDTEKTGIGIVVGGSGSATISGGTAIGNTAGVRTNSSGSSVAISGNGTVSSTSGTGVDVGSGTVTISGGTVTGGSGVGIEARGGNVSISDGTFTSTTGDSISVSGGTLTMTGGTVTSDSGKGVQVSSGALIMNSGTVSSGKGNGIGVTGGNVTISGGTVSSQGGIAVYVGSSGSVSMPGSSSAKISSAASVGIYVATGGTANIADGSVEGSVCGIQHIASTTDAAKNVTISGTAVITLTAVIPEDGSFEGYAVSGPFTFSGGTLRAKADGYFYYPEFQPTVPEGKVLTVPTKDGEYFTVSVTTSEL